MANPHEPTQGVQVLLVTMSQAAHSNALTALARFAESADTQADLSLIRQAVKSYLEDSGKIPLERYLRLPTTHTAWRKSRRDSWLCIAAALVNAESVSASSHRLENEWNTFLSRGPWLAWRDDAAPPSEATPMSKALFYATKLNRSQALNAKQISRIVGHVFAAKCPRSKVKIAP